MSIRELGRRVRRILLFGWYPEEVRWACSCLWKGPPSPDCPMCEGRGYWVTREWVKDVRLSGAEMARVETARDQAARS